MAFTPVAGESVDIVLELPNGDQMGFLCRADTGMRRARASDYAPIVAAAGIETEATGTWRRWKQETFDGGLGEEEWEAGNRVLYSEYLEFRDEFVTLGGTWPFLHTSLAMHHFCDFDSDIYCLNGTKVYKYDITGESWSEAKDLAATATDLLVIDDALFALCGDGSNGFYSTDGSEWTNMDVAGTVMIWWLENAWRSNGNTLYSTATPKTGGSWSTGQAVGDAQFEITSLAVYDSKVYIGKEEALFYYDGTAVAEVKDCRHRAYTGNFKGMAAWAGYLFFQVMSTVYRYHPTSELDITPRYVGGKDEEFYGWGIPLQFLPAQKGIYCLFDDAKGIHHALLKYTGSGWARIDSGTSVTIAPAGIGWSRTENWLLWGAAGKTYYQQRRTLADAPSDDYVATGYFITPYFDGGFAEEEMEIRLCTIEGDDLNSTEKVTVYYELDRAGSWTELGDFTVSPQQQRSFAELAGAISGREMRLKVELHRAAGDTSLTPRLRGWSVQFKNRPRPLYVYTPELLLGHNLQRRDKMGRIENTLLEQLRFLDECASASTPLVYYMPHGHSMLVDLTNSQRGEGWVGKGDKHEPTVVLSLIQAYAGEWLTLEQAVATAEQVTFTTHEYLVVLWAREDLNPGELSLEKTERYWGLFTYGGEPPH